MKHALIMAAGIGSRMMPLTKQYAKPLVPVLGTTMIETVIQSMPIDVVKIFIVVGYKKEQFEFLTQKYKNITLIENTEYTVKNNISSIMAGADYVGEADCYICEADLYISDPSLFSGVHHSCYFGKHVQGFSNDWVFETKNGRITRVKKNGTDLYNMVGISFWKVPELRILLSAVRETYKQPNHDQMYWDEVVDRNLDKINLCVHPVTGDQIFEIDTIAELEQFLESKKYK